MIHISVIFKDYGFSVRPFLIMLYIATILVSSHILGLMMVSYGTNLVALSVINNASNLDCFGRSIGVIQYGNYLLYLLIIVTFRNHK